MMLCQFYRLSFLTIVATMALLRWADSLPWCHNGISVGRKTAVRFPRTAAWSPTQLVQLASALLRISAWASLNRATSRLRTFSSLNTPIFSAQETPPSMWVRR